MREFVVTRRGPGWREAFASAFTHPERLICRPETWMYQTSDRTMVALVRVDGVPLVLKLFFRTALVDRLESVFLGPPAARVARNIKRMRAAGFETPELVAVLMELPALALGRSCAVTRPVEGGIRADDLWRKMGTAGRIRLARVLGEYVRALHASGVYPQDTRVGNILVVQDGDAWRLVLVDLDRVRVYRRVSWQRRLKNLVQIERSLGREARRSEKLAFLSAYLGPVGRAELVRRGEEILAASQRKDTARGGG